MEFQPPLIEGCFVRRYKRFFVDAEVGGELVTAHCPNPGSMLGLESPGLRVWLSPATDPSRALRYTLELVEVQNEAGRPCLVGVNSLHPNRLIEEAVQAGSLASLAGYSRLRREVRYGENSRIDLLLEGEERPPCYVEVKNVHLCRRAGLAEFPDSVTARGAKHLRELSAATAAGCRAVLVFCIQRADCTRFAVARDIDPAYGTAFDLAVAAGVEIVVAGCHITPAAIAVCPTINLAIEGCEPSAAAAAADKREIPMTSRLRAASAPRKNSKAKQNDAKSR